ncbi:K+-transporting ATPase B subunit [Actinopolymorpha pittospori]|uniref:K+-transporting ATPase B subunit n=1 Tax=Actinopolymorpha pittospori TaxID=648752 RepID=A0A927N587_9ACTN|nr:K+-transporting ATPase B subunit [Actinopolymorpha pittospori]
MTGGTKVLSDRIVVRITQEPGASFLDRMIALVEGANRKKTPNELALNLLLVMLTFVFLVAVVTVQPMAIFSKAFMGAARDTEALTSDGVTGIVLVSLLVCLIPTTIGGLLSAIGIAGMDRLVQRNVLAMSGRAVEAAGDVNTLLLDKTGTITYGNRQAVEFLLVDGVAPERLADAALRSSLADETPEGRSIVDLAHRGTPSSGEGTNLPGALWVAFSATTRMSGVDLPEGHQLRKGAATAVADWVEGGRGTVPATLAPLVEGVSAAGGTPLVVAERVDDQPARVLGVIHLKDVVKPGLAARFGEMRRMGIRTVMVTGDNPVTAKAIAAEAGVDDFVAEATPEDKLALIRREQADGHLIAMTGDGTNDAPALAQADVGVAMSTGTSAAKEAGNMVDLDSDPTKIMDIVEIGKQLLITRGALTTFSIANDIAKYFAILPAMFGGVYPSLRNVNIMQLHSPTSAILSAVIFNAVVIVALIRLPCEGCCIGRAARPTCSPGTCGCTAWAGWSCRSSRSSSSTSPSSRSSPGSDHVSSVCGVLLAPPVVGGGPGCRGDHRGGGPGLPARDDRRRAGAGAALQGPGIAGGRSRRQAGRKFADRSVVQRRRRTSRARLLPAAAVQRGRRVRRRRLGSGQPRSGKRRRHPARRG